MSDDWSKGDTETWKKSDFDDCAKMLFKVQDLPQLTMVKKGRDSLVVKSAEVSFDVIDNPPKKMRLVCDGFKLEGECGKDGKFCTKTLQNCRKSEIIFYLK